jgi:hypothetical protein
MVPSSGPNQFFACEPDSGSQSSAPNALISSRMMRSRWRRGPVAASPSDGFSAGFMKQPCIAAQRDFASSGPAVSATATLAQVGFGSELSLDDPNGLGNEACKLDAPAPSRPFD